MKLLIELHLLPSLEYFCLLQQFEAVQLEKSEHFVKQSYRNRYQINTAQGIETLIVPLTSKHGKVSIKEVRIDYSQKWQNNHWRTIESAYRKAPYFEFYADELKRMIYSEHEYLFDLSLNLLSFCLKSLKSKVAISFTESYEKNYSADFLDLRSHILAKKGFFERSIYKPVTYYQVFGNAFVENLSLIDLLFCEGPRASALLQASQKEVMNK